MNALQPSAMTCNSLDRPVGRIDRKHHQLELSELVDNQWLQRYYHSSPAPSFGNRPPIEDYRDAYLFGIRARSQNKVPYHEVCEILEEAWNDLIGPSVLGWEQAEPIIQYAYTCCGIRSPRRFRLSKQAAA